MLMSIEKMRLVKIRGDNEKLDETVHMLMRCGFFQPESASKVFSSSMGFIPYTQENPYSQRLADINSLFESIGFTPSLDEDAAYEALTEDDVTHIELLHKKAMSIAERKASLEEQMEKCRDGIEKFSHFKGLSVDLDKIAELEYVKVRFGHLPKSSVEKLNTLFDGCPYFYFVPCSTDKTDYWGAYFAPRNRTDEVDGIFAMLLFEPLQIPGAAGTVENIIKELENNLSIISEQTAVLNAEIKELREKEKDFFSKAYSKLAALNEAQQLKSFSVHNGHFFMLAGWIPKKRENEFTRCAAEVEGIVTETTVPDTEKNNPPVKLKKMIGPLKYLVDPYKFYVDMYGTPSYSDIDVTSFVAITYTVLFGIMFGDMGQGFVLVIAGLLMYKLKKMALGKILVPCGISSMCFGFIFGSVFGYEDMLDPVYKSLGWAGKPLAVMESVNTVLLVAIAIGIALTAFSMVINVYACIRKKHFGEAIFSQNGLVGILVYLAGVNFASGFMGGPAPLPDSVCFAVIGAGAVILMIKEIPIGIIDRHPDWKPTSIMDFILQNIFELLEYVLSYLSNTVSFLRVGAFVLVHAGMMMVVFSLAGESENIFVIILGNILVIALEGLLTGIQALRLEYYEMFSRFYEGSGRPFNPFSIKKLSFGGNQK